MMKRSAIFKLFVLLMTFAAVPAYAQLWEPLDEGLPDAPQSICTDNNSIYAAYTRDFYNTIEVWQWNGLLWQRLPVIKTNGQGEIKAMTVFQNELYVGGTFDAVQGISGSQKILKFNGVQWTGILGGIGTGTGATLSQQHINDLAVYNNKLYIAGLFQGYDGKDSANNIAVYDGTSYSFLGSANNQGTNAEIYDLEVGDGKLFVAGSFSSAGGAAVENLGYWNGASWQPVSNPGPFINQTTKVAWFAGDLFAYGDGQLKKRNGNGWQSAAGSVQFTLITDMQVFNNELWIAGDFIIGGNTYHVVHGDGSIWQNSANISTINGQVLDVYGSDLILGGLFESSEGINADHVVKFIAGKGYVKGKVFHDMNGNCTYDNGEPVLSELIIRDKAGEALAVTDEDGNYQILLASGTQNIELLISDHFVPSGCNLLTKTININAGIIDSGNHFAVKVPAGISDIDIKVASRLGWRARQGFEEDFYLFYENKGSLNISSQDIFLYVPEKFNYVSSDHLPISTSNSIVKWTLNNIQPGTKGMIKVVLKIDVDIPSKSIKKVVAYAAHGTDMFLDNNLDTLEQEVRGAFDPNEKYCEPCGFIPPDKRKIRYNINFQNTGTDTAYRVTVVDTIDKNFDLGAVYYNQSHRPNVKMIPLSKPWVMKWVFTINLPDSNIDEPGSHGWIFYDLMLKNDLPLETKVDNTAYIYFDYQKHIKTNEATLIISVKSGINDLASSSDLHVFPNPASTWLEINHSAELSGKKMILINVMGQTVKELNLNSNGTTRVDVSELSSSVYFYTIPGSDQKGKIVIQ